MINDILLEDWINILSRLDYDVITTYDLNFYKGFMITSSDDKWKKVCFTLNAEPIGIIGFHFSTKENSIFMGIKDFYDGYQSIIREYFVSKKRDVKINYLTSEC